jgi:hypothetical protein
MTEYVTGQIYGWNGGECPVHPEAVVEYWTRSGRTSALRSKATCLEWEHGNSIGDIIAFKVITPYAEPKVIWVNESKGGYLAVYDSEKAAKSYAHSGHARVAVKYVEEKK